MSEIIQNRKTSCFLCAGPLARAGAQAIELRTREDPHPTKVIICARCYEEIFGPQKKENTNANKES